MSENHLTPVDTDETTDTTPTGPESRTDFFNRVRGGIKTRRSRFHLAGQAEWADLIGFGLSAEQLAEVNAAENDDSPDAAERAAFIKCDMLAGSVAAWSLPVPATVDELATWPQNVLDAVFEAIATAGQHLPKDRQKGKKRH